MRLRPASFAGYQTRALIRAGSRGPIVLCLHGFADSAEGYRPLFEALQGVPGQLIALDLPGVDDGPPLAPRPARVLPQLRDFALAAIEHYASEDRPLLLLGHSLGGRTALAAAAQTSRQLAGVIAMAPAPLRLNAAQRLLGHEQTLLPKVLPLLRHLPDGFMRRRLLAGYRRNFHAPDEVDPAIFEQAVEGIGAERVAGYAEALHRLGGELNDALDLSPLTVPVDLVWGRNDRMVPASGAAAYRARIKHARYHEVPDCGHEIARERPEAVATLLAERIAEASSPDRPSTKV